MNISPCSNILPRNGWISKYFQAQLLVLHGTVLLAGKFAARAFLVAVSAVSNFLGLFFFYNFC